MTVGSKIGIPIYFCGVFNENGHRCHKEESSWTETLIEITADNVRDQWEQKRRERKSSKQAQTDQ
jgi:hypothetical protein